jgi:hypothetical protein
MLLRVPHAPVAAPAPRLPWARRMRCWVADRQASAWAVGAIAVLGAAVQGVDLGINHLASGVRKLRFGSVVVGTVVSRIHHDTSNMRRRDASMAIPLRVPTPEEVQVVVLGALFKRA